MYDRPLLRPSRMGSSARAFLRTYCFKREFRKLVDILRRLRRECRTNFCSCYNPFAKHKHRRGQKRCTGVWSGSEIAFKPSKLQNEGENPGKGHFYILRQTLVFIKPWFKRDLRRGHGVSKWQSSVRIIALRLVWLIVAALFHCCCK